MADDLSLAFAAIEGGAVPAPAPRRPRTVADEVAEEFGECARWHEEHPAELWELRARLVWDEDRSRYVWR